MKTIITLFTTTMLVAGATSAMAFDRQATDDALDYATSAQASQGFGGAFASARVPGEIRNSTVDVPTQYDFQMDGR
jgi:O-glycosyl hydrolase